MSRVVYVASIAQGGGDVAFASRMCRALGTSPICPFDVAISVQAGRDAGSIRGHLLECLQEGQGSDAADAAVIARVREALVYERVGGGVQRPADTPAHAGAPVRLVLQGPLLVFSSAEEACGTLGLTAAPEARLLTLREFGQGRFCSCTPRHVDVSTGLDSDEVGVWRIERPSGVLPPSPHSQPAVHVTAYYRERSHGAQAGRVVASALVWGEGERARPPPPMTLLLPGEEYVQALLAGLHSHPEVADVSYAPAPSGGGGGGAACEGSPSSASAALCASDPLGSACVTTVGGHAHAVRLHGVASRRLSPASFQSLLAQSVAAVVCGDGSLNEALSFGTPFWYSADGHKVFTRHALYAVVARAARGAPPSPLDLVAAYWAFVEGGGEEAWSAVRALAGRDAPGAALRDAFASLRARAYHRDIELHADVRTWLPRPTGDLGAWLQGALPALLSCAPP